MTAKWNTHWTRPRSVMGWPLFQVRRKNLAWEQTMFEDLRRERMIRKALRAIARQRVTLILQPGNVIVVENGTPDAEWFNVAVQTSHIRGWVDILHDSIPSGTVQFEGRNPILPKEMNPKTMYRLTEGGWSVINRSHGWVIATFFICLLTLTATMATVF